MPLFNPLKHRLDEDNPCDKGHYPTYRYISSRLCVECANNGNGSKMRFEGPIHLFANPVKKVQSDLKHHYEVDLRVVKFSEFKAKCEEH